MLRKSKQLLHKTLSMLGVFYDFTARKLGNGDKKQRGLMYKTEEFLSTGLFSLKSRDAYDTMTKNRAETNLLYGKVYKREGGVLE